MGATVGTAGDLHAQGAPVQRISQTVLESVADGTAKPFAEAILGGKCLTPDKWSHRNRADSLLSK
jgi:hypothetical protein